MSSFNDWWESSKFGAMKFGIHERLMAQAGWDAAQVEKSETFVADVRKFAEAAGHTTDEFNVRQTALYIGLQLEEMAEKLEAIGILNGLHSQLELNAEKFKSGWFDPEIELANRDEMLDADVDLAWVTIGSMLSQGADVTGAMNEVVRSNMSKMVEGCMVKDANGKVVKPDTYSPPNLAPFVKNV